MASKLKQKVKSAVKTAKKKVAAKRPALKMKKKVSAVPKNYRTVNAHVVFSDCNGGIEFLKRAFGAKETGRMPMPDGKVAHAELKIGDTMLMVSDEQPGGGSSAKTLGGSAVGLMLYVKDVDATVKSAIAAGAKETMPVSDQFWGDRYGKVVDPFGNEWAIATHVEDVSMKEMMKRMAAMPPPTA